jgi:hypothetical protein
MDGPSALSTDELTWLQASLILDSPPVRLCPHIPFKYLISSSRVPLKIKINISLRLIFQFLILYLPMIQLPRQMFWSDFSWIANKEISK